MDIKDVFKRKFFDFLDFPTNLSATEKRDLDLHRNFAILHNETSKNNAHLPKCWNDKINSQSLEDTHQTASAQ